MSEKVSIDGLSAAIVKDVSEYTGAVQKAVKDEAKKVANDILKDVKAAAPVKKGNYRKGFKVADESTSLYADFKIHNAKFPYLVHLLENGHALRSGGRTRAFPHMRPSEAKGKDTFEKAVERIIKEGG